MSGLFTTHRRSQGGRASALLLASLTLIACGDSTSNQPASNAQPSQGDQPARADAASSASEGGGQNGSPVAPAAVGYGRPLSDAQVAAFNRGVGLMGAFRFEDAEAAFDALAAELGAEHPFARLATRNLAIARLNQTSDGAQERALALLEPLVASDPTDINSHYCIGLIQLFLGSPDIATEHFRVAAEADRNDPYAAFYLAQCREFEGNADEARTWYRRAIEIDPYLRSPLLGLQRIESRAGNVEEAARLLETFQSMADNPRARLAEFKYSRMGRKGEAMVPAFLRATEPAPSASQPLLVASVAEVIGSVPWRSGVEGEQASVTVADIDGDGRVDLFGAQVLEGGRSAVFLAGPDGSWRWIEDHPLAAVRAVRAALWGDIDNDGDLDAVLLRAGGADLFAASRDAAGRLTHRLIGELPLAIDGFDPVDGVLADLDHDGDLDVFLVNAAGPSELLANERVDGDGIVRFRPIGASSGAVGSGRPARGVLVNDIDGDRDADILLLHDSPPHELLMNERLWRWAPHEVPNGDLAERLVGAIAGDWNADGVPTLLAAGPSGVLHVSSITRGAWTRSRNEGAQIGTPEDRSFAVADMTGRGVPNLLWREEAEFVIAALDGTAQARVAIPAGAGAPLAWTPILRGTDGPAVAMFTTSGIVDLAPAAGRGAFATIRFAGRTDPSLSMRSNASGIGTSFAARIGDHWVGGDTFRTSTGRGQSAQPTAIGLGSATQVDFLSMEWSDGVFQTELDLAAGSESLVTETQRQISSCPVIFAWTGEHHSFVTDCLGVGGIGFLVAPGEYAPSRPWERVLFPATLRPVERNDAIEILLGEPMEEACYLDAARLVAYELPAGWSMTIDERMGIGGPEPTGEPRFYRTERWPIRAFDGDGRDQTELVQRVDYRAVELDRIDTRHLGYLLAPQTLTLEFDAPLDALPGVPTLVADGWVEYPYSQTNFAAWQAGIAAQAPNLEARGADGVWREVYPSWGYPAGMTREMSLPLLGLPEGTTALRMTSNLEIYWDAIRVVGAEQNEGIRRVALPLREALVRDGGFAERIERPQKRPDYDATRRLPLWDTRHQPGFYTDFGLCTELLLATDDAIAIFGPGEEVVLRFDPAPLRELVARGARLSDDEQTLIPRLVLEVDGWCKDFDLFTRDGETLGPLPTRSGEPLDRDSAARRLNDRFNTRYRDGR
jgi:tetratricopeptide (TPR) repeat protein